MTKNRHILLPRKRWTLAEDDLFRKLYPRTKNRELAARFRRSVSAIDGRSHVLGLHKDPEWLHAQNVATGLRLSAAGVGHHFPKGNVPANKGLRRPGYSIGRGRMRETQFKKGHKNENNGIHAWRPIGSLRIDADGYLSRKVTETGRGWRWRPGPMRPIDRRGQRCRIVACGKMNSVCVEFEDGFRVITSRYAVRKAK